MSTLLHLAGVLSISPMTSSCKDPPVMQRWKKILWGSSWKLPGVWPVQALWGWLLPLFSCYTVLAHGEEKAMWLGWIWALGVQKTLPDKQPQPLYWDRPFSPADEVWEITCLGIICSASHVNFLCLSGSARLSGCLGKAWCFQRDRESWWLVCASWQDEPGPLNVPCGKRMPLDLTFSFSFRRQDLLNDLLMKLFRWTLYPLWSRVFCCPYLSGMTLAGCCDHILQQVWGHLRLLKLESSSS